MVSGCEVASEGPLSSGNPETLKANSRLELPAEYQAAACRCLCGRAGPTRTRTRPGLGPPGVPFDHRVPQRSECRAQDEHGRGACLRHCRPQCRAMRRNRSRIISSLQLGVPHASAPSRRADRDTDRPRSAARPARTRALSEDSVLCCLRRTHVPELPQVGPQRQGQRPCGAVRSDQRDEERYLREKKFVPELEGPATRLASNERAVQLEDDLLEQAASRSSGSSGKCWHRSIANGRATSKRTLG